ncbi:MAG: hypothetical protein ACYCZV_00460 [Acidimicrobiales bacterium]
MDALPEGARTLGDHPEEADLGELPGILPPWGDATRKARGYPAAGPHDIARRPRS